MKKALTLAFILISIGVDAQYSKTKKQNFITNIEVSIPTTALLTTFAINDYRINNKIGTEKQTAMIAATGLLTSTILHFGIKYIRKSKLIKRKL